MNRSKTQDIVAGENISTVIGVSSERPAQSTSWNTGGFLHICGGNTTVTWNTWEVGNAYGNQSDLLHEEGSNHVSQGQVYQMALNSRECDSAKDIKHTGPQTPQPVLDLL